MIELDGPIHIVQLPDFSEGSWISKRNRWYYLLYAYQYPEKIAYAMSRNIDGPWVFKGIINEIATNSETNSPTELPDFISPVWVVLKSLYDMVTTGDVTRIKECPACGWVFYDETKNGKRRWCNPLNCGTKDKMNRYAKKLRDQGNEE